MGTITLVERAAQEKDDMRRGLIQKFTTESVFMNLLRFVPVDGFSYEYGEQATLGGIAFRALNETYEPSAGIVNPRKERLALFGGTVEMDHQLQGSVTHTNAILAKTRAAALFYDYNVINGDTSKSPKQFDGLKRRIQASQTIYAGENGGSFEMDLMDQLLDKVAGPNSGKVILMSKYQKRKYRRKTFEAAAGATLADVTGTQLTYDGARIVVLDEDDVETPILPQTEERGSSNATGSMYCIRLGGSDEGEYVQGLVKGSMVEHKPLAQVNTRIGDLIEMFAGLGVFHGRAAARLAGLL